MNQYNEVIKADYLHFFKIVSEISFSVSYFNCNPHFLPFVASQNIIQKTHELTAKKSIVIKM